MKVLELFSGIGGMHYSLIESKIDHKVVRALDINTTANRVYKSNFPETMLMENNVQCLTEDILNKMDIDLITMSPPCQPFTRQGLQKGSEDNRSDALKHILQLIPKIQTLKWILLENVVGFDSSSTREEVIAVLASSCFRYQEFILSPTQFYIPNSRTRYYLLAKKKSMPFVFEEISDIHAKIPFVTDENISNLINKYKGCADRCFSIEKILDSSGGVLLPDKVLLKYSNILDIVTKDSNRSCCFTKGYTHYTEGTGSVYCPHSSAKIDEVYKKIKDMDRNCVDYLNELKSLELRYFSPTEVSKLMAFPNNFKFPSNLSLKQQYRLLGNSINVHVVAILIKLLIR